MNLAATPGVYNREEQQPARRGHRSESCASHGVEPGVVSVNFQRETVRSVTTNAEAAATASWGPVAHVTYMLILTLAPAASLFRVRRSRTRALTGARPRRVEEVFRL